MENTAQLARRLLMQSISSCFSAVKFHFMRGSKKTKTPVPPHPLTPESTILEIGSHRIAVSVEESTHTLTTLLLINGIGANLELFNPFINALNAVDGKERGTIRFDVPGVGASPPTLLPYRLEGLAKMVAELLDELDEDHVDVLGISWGGGLAQQFAHQFPERCRRLILVATSTGAISIPGSPRTIMKLMSPRRYFQPSYRASIAGELYGGHFRRDPTLIRHYSHLFRAPGFRGYYGQLFAATGWTSIHWLHRLKQPTLILAGDDDPIIPLSNARLMARLIPKSTLHIVHDGHLFLLTEAESIAPVVHKFLF